MLEGICTIFNEEFTIPGELSLRDLFQTDLIKESCSPYSASTTLALKKEEEKKTRFYVDICKLNTMTKTNAKPLP